ncbi:MAG TPA: hypothetical protein VFZ34_14575 [Blastocatellia bacterium]|nr:hypothetical protein [Blastocatellia bacterium]
MPKDPSKNIDQYKIRGGHLNSFEFQQNQNAFAHNKAEQEPPWTTPPTNDAEEFSEQPPAKGNKKAAAQTKAKPAKTAQAATRTGSTAKSKTAQKAPAKARSKR